MRLCLVLIVILSFSMPAMADVSPSSNLQNELNEPLSISDAQILGILWQGLSETSQQVKSALGQLPAIAQKDSKDQVLYFLSRAEHDSIFYRRRADKSDNRGVLQSRSSDQIINLKSQSSAAEEVDPSSAEKSRESFSIKRASIRHLARSASKLRSSWSKYKQERDTNGHSEQLQSLRQELLKDCGERALNIMDEFLAIDNEKKKGCSPQNCIPQSDT